MPRYEVTMESGWKVRVNAIDAEEAKQKAERYAKKDGPAIAVEECAEMSYREFAKEFGL